MAEVGKETHIVESALADSTLALLDLNPPAHGVGEACIGDKIFKEESIPHANWVASGDHSTFSAYCTCFLQGRLQLLPGLLHHLGVLALSM